MKYFRDQFQRHVKTIGYIGHYTGVVIGAQLAHAMILTTCKDRFQICRSRSRSPIRLKTRNPGAAPALTRLGPVLYGSGSGLIGAGSEFFMHSIVFNAEIEINSVINSVPEPVPGPKIGSGSEQRGTGPARLPLRLRLNWDRTYGSGPGPGKTGTVTYSTSYCWDTLYVS